MMSTISSGKRELTIEQKEARLGYILILPSVLLLSLVIFYPVGYNIYLSFNKVSIGKAARFIGFANYITILEDPSFWSAFWTTLIYTICTVIGSTVVGVIVALLMNNPFPQRRLARGIILLPYVAPLISLVFAWQYIFHPVYGYVNYLFVDVIPIFNSPRDWVESPKYALPMVIFFDIWRNFPFAFLMVLAKLQSISKSLYESAEVDGAGAWAKFRYITLPELTFVIGAAVVLRWIWNFNKFDEIWLLSRNVEVIPIYTYLRAFQTFRMGEAAAISTMLVIFLVIMVITFVRKVLKW